MSRVALRDRQAGIGLDWEEARHGVGKIAMGAYKSGVPLIRS